MTRLLLLALMAVLAIAAVAVRAGAKVAEGGPDRLDDTKSLADRIKAGRTVHIVFVHGMRAEGETMAAAARGTPSSRYSSANCASRRARQRTLTWRSAPGRIRRPTSAVGSGGRRRNGTPASRSCAAPNCREVTGRRWSWTRSTGGR